MPYFVKVSLALLIIAFGAGQWTLHEPASHSEQQEMKMRVSYCPSLGPIKDGIPTKWDYIRMVDNYRLMSTGDWLLSLFDIQSDSCIVDD